MVSRRAPLARTLRGLWIRGVSWQLLACAFLGAIACTSATQPTTSPTLLVNNSTCALGRCTTLEIRAFVWKFTAPQPPQGFEAIGEVPPGQSCLQFPPSWTFKIIGPDSTGVVDTLAITWTPSDTDQVYVVAVDSAVFHSGMDSAQVDSLNHGLLPYFDGLGGGAVGETSNFVPGTSHGWKVSFPSSPVFSASLTSVPACKS